mmetsp:Transcript_96022/g.190327  ORF Transcript_96022/g.190327 Transcript_96022/m.190327 type:complete len:217 (-) Transcript_96022:148-798(-)
MGSSGSELRCCSMRTSRRRLSISVGMSPTLLRQPTVSSVSRTSSRRIELVVSEKSRCKSWRLCANSSVWERSLTTSCSMHLMLESPPLSCGCTGGCFCSNSSRKAANAPSKSLRCTWRAAANESCACWISTRSSWEEFSNSPLSSSARLCNASACILRSLSSFSSLSSPPTSLVMPVRTFSGVRSSLPVASAASFRIAASSSAAIRSWSRASCSSV